MPSAHSGIKTSIGQFTAAAKVAAAIAALPQDEIASGGRVARDAHGVNLSSSAKSRCNKIDIKCRAF